MDNETEDFLFDLIMVLHVHEMDLTIDLGGVEIQLGPYLKKLLKPKYTAPILTLVPKY